MSRVPLPFLQWLLRRNRRARAEVIIGPDVNNGDFEFAGAGGADIFTHWGETVAGTSAISRDTSVFHSGLASCKFVIDGSNSDAYVSQSVLTVGRRYQASFVAKVDSVTGSPRIRTGSTAGTDNVSFALSTLWQRFTAEFIAAATGFVIANFTGCTSRTLWIDDVTLVPG